VPNSEYVHKLVLSHGELERYRNAAETPLEKLIITYQIDAFLRPNDSYLRYRSKAQKKRDEDKLIIIPSGNRRGLPPSSKCISVSH